jgi:hypothetical protein
MSDKQAVDVFTEDDGHLALPVEPFRRILRPTGCRLDPIDGFPVVWRFTEGQGGQSGVVLNVLGFLNGGAMSISSRGWLYETERDGHPVALFLPGGPKRMRLSETRYKVLTAEAGGAPLFPAAWPKEAVLRVIRVRFRTIIVLNAEFLLAQVPRLPPPAVAPAPAPPADPPPADPQPPQP